MSSPQNRICVPTYGSNCKSNIHFLNNIIYRQYFLPPNEMITYGWVKQVLSGQKQWLKNNQVVHCSPPRYDEISVANLYDQCLKLQYMAAFFPDTYPKGRSCNRDYFFSILATVQPEYCEKLIRECKDKRFTITDQEQEQKAIVITEEWAMELKQFPQFARSKGRMIHLLAQKSKVGIATKSRKKFKAFTPEDYQTMKNTQEETTKNSQTLLANSQNQPQTTKKIAPKIVEKYDQVMNK